MTFVVLVLWNFAVMRATRLINYDTIMFWLHNWAGRRWGPGSWQVEFLECPWCVGMWLSLLSAWFPILIITEGLGETLLWWWLYLPMALTCSMVIGLFKPLYHDTDIAIEE